MEGLVIDSRFWRGKRVLLTGHTGFKGSWLALWLRHLGAEVTGYALTPPTEPSLYGLARVQEGIRDLRGDVRDLESVCKALQATNPEIVIHMAAQSLVRRSYAEPVETYSTNLMGTVHVLEAVRRASGIRAVLIVTSDKCYENREGVWSYRENEPMGGYDPYSSSKGCAELAAVAYRRSYLHGDTAVASARAGNVIGGGDWAEDRLIPDMMRAARDRRTARIRNPHAVRPWQHVLEPLSGYLLLAERLYRDGQAFAEAWNFGPADEDAKSVEWIAREMTSLWEDVRWMQDDTSHPHEAEYLSLDCSKARARLGWIPRLPLSEALSWTVQWYRGYDAGLDMRRLTEEQIQSYSGLVQA